MKKLIGIVAVMLLVTGGCVNIQVPQGAVVIGGGGNGRIIPSQLPAGGSATGSWSDLAARMAGQVFLSAERGVVFYAFDTLAYPQEPVELLVDVLSARSLQGVKGVTVAFRDADGNMLAGATTDKSGRAAASWTPPEAGNFTLTVRVIAVDDDDDEELLELSPATLLVAARDSDAEQVIIDLDHTVVDSSFFRVLTIGATPMDDSARVTHRIADHYGVVYLTHRPDLMTRKSKQWLRDHGYPQGPLLVSQLNQAVGSSGAYKTERLRALREAFPNTRIGIGDKPSDARAYLDNGMTAYLIPNYDADDAEELRETAADIRSLPQQDRLQVVENWRQIEAGVFDGERFPPAAYADELERRADSLRRNK